MVLARFEKGETPAQIARGLGVTPQAVYQHLHKLREEGRL